MLTTRNPIIFGNLMLQIFHRLLLLSMTGCPDCSLVSGLRMFKTYDREPLSVHELSRKGSRDTNLYTISLDDMLKTSLICLLSKASKTKSCLWHHRLSHLNFGTLNKLAKDGLVRGLLETDIQEKDKNRSQNDKTEHKNGKTVRRQEDQ
ncbi:integrase, catalytic region, zinc finger, CCHC-type containing protein, partial [Tanacetum coccineum]